MSLKFNQRTVNRYASRVVSKYVEMLNRLFAEGREDEAYALIDETDPLFLRAAVAAYAKSWPQDDTLKVSLKLHG